MAKPSGVTVVIPTLNEADVIAAVVREIPRAVATEIIVADSGSTDGTQRDRRRGRRPCDRFGPARLRPRLRPRRCTAADPASDVIVFMDGDGADRADLMHRLVDPIRAGTHDFVIASRTRGEREPGSMSWHQVFAGQAAGLGMRALYGVRYTDMCAFRAIRRSSLLALGLREMTYGWNIEMQMQAARAGLRILEVPLPYRCRAGGQSKVAGSLKGSLRAGWRIVTTFARVAGSRAAGQPAVRMAMLAAASLAGVAGCMRAGAGGGPGCRPGGGHGHLVDAGPRRRGGAVCLPGRPVRPGRGHRAVQSGRRRRRRTCTGIRAATCR